MTAAAQMIHTVVTNRAGRKMYVAFFDDGLGHCFDDKKVFCGSLATPERGGEDEDRMCVDCMKKAEAWATLD